MKKTVISLVILSSLFFVIGVPVVMAATTATDGSGDVQSGIVIRGISPACQNNGDCSLCDMVQVGVNISDLLVSLAGAVAILMLIIGGIFMITAYGSDRITAGKNIVVATIIGILIMLSAWTIVNTLVLAVFGVTDGAFLKGISTVAPGATGLTKYDCNAAATTKK